MSSGAIDDTIIPRVNNQVTGEQQQFDLPFDGIFEEFGEAESESNGEKYSQKDTYDDALSIPLEITEELLKEVQQDLGLVNLCWSQADIEQDPEIKAPVTSYSTVSEKEKLLAWYTEQFRRQFHLTHPNRRPLLLMCENESGVQKFVSTTIRRSTLPYPELYTWQGCGKFVSDYIEYEPLDNALGLPKRLCSPTWVLESQKGNCFEFATVLASLLLGQGYNAYVVSGYASREQTTYDMSRIVCPFLPEAQESQVKMEDDEMIKYRIKLPSEFRSQFEVDLAQEEEEREKAEIRRKEAQRLKRIEKLEYPGEDEYRGYRVHAWVVILGESKGPRSHEISEPFYIEPSSGLAYNLSVPQTSQLYLGVESIWNDLNYWVNVQPRAKSCASINWDLSKAEFWQHLLPGEPLHMRGSTEIVEEEVRLQQEKHLDMPVSYVKEIRILDQNWRRRYPGGRKTMFYKKAKVEWFAPYNQPDGLVERVSVYDDYDHMVNLEIHEKYENRMDHLVMSKKYPQTDSIIDYYKRGRPDRCKEHRYFMSSNEAVTSERVIEFYSVARIDGLSRIETSATKLAQYYSDRQDLLCYRSVQFSSDRRDTLQNDIHFRQILSIVEKYERNREIPANRDIASREFELSENEIRLMFHYNDDNYTRATRTYIKPPLAERGERLVLNRSMMQEYYPDPNSLGEKPLNLFYELEKQLDDEDRAISQARAGEDDVMSFLKIRREEYLTPQLSISPFDVQRIPDSEKDRTTKGDMAQPEKDFKESVDHLKPYLAQLGNPTEITESQAYILRDKSLNHFKQMMVNRANKLLRKIEQCSQDLERTQAILTQGEDLAREEKDKIMERCNALTFELHVLQVRLNRHRELTGERYRTLTRQLEQSEHLKALRNYTSSQNLE